MGWRGGLKSLALCLGSGAALGVVASSAMGERYLNNRSLAIADEEEGGKGIGRKGGRDGAEQNY